MLTISDRFSLLKMDWLTKAGQSLLPPGHWAGPSQSEVLVDGDNKTLYLTFDDGPFPETTETLLEILEREEVLATFFLIGEHVSRYPELAERVSRGGHAIGSHSNKHFLLPALSANALEKDLRSANAAIEDATGQTPKLFRPPYGIIDNRSAQCLKDLEMEIVYWGSVPEDWQAVGTNRVVERVSSSMQNGKLIVLHEGKHIAEQTILATQEIIARAKKRGFKFGIISPSASL